MSIFTNSLIAISIIIVIFTADSLCCHGHKGRHRSSTTMTTATPPTISSSTIATTTPVNGVSGSIDPRVGATGSNGPTDATTASTAGFKFGKL